MGKNKNNRFDLAKRQEKILKRMAKPLYKKQDNSIYFVITQPFGMHPSPAERGAVDVSRLSSWISWVFRRESAVEAVYTMSTRDEVVVRIAHGVNPDLMLGKHKYHDILAAGWPWPPGPVSCAFIYDYQNNGDPSDHNWREHVGPDEDAPPGHFRNPYPSPTWTVRPSHLSGLVLALPGSVPRSPEPSPEPPSGGPSRARGEVKREPKRFPPQMIPSSAPDRVKDEPLNQTDPSIASGEPAYEPSQELRDQIALLYAARSQASEHVTQEPVTQIKHEPRDYDPMRFRSETYDLPNTDTRSRESEVQSLAPVPGPSRALWDERSRYRSKHSDPVNAGKHELNTPQTAEQPPSTQSRGTTEAIDFVPREPLPSSKRVKPEPADENEQPWKRPKME
ncbi:hypothetical protein F5148DRAFT_80433 [Russula earlei]|uniref:Uncharacterized protein n=1 Tax=Russula earlei TaxID=71964 RepID=A0ACC0U9D7_9AGAM|nr:hypothetical protein F5148DRAFT_80433 [Russula earlei]